LNDSISYVGLGDRLDAIMIAKMLYDRDKQPVTMHQLRGQFQDFFELVSLYDMKVSIQYPRMPDLRFSSFFEHNAKGYDQMKLLKTVDDFPKIQVKDLNLDLPEKFATVQFDGKQGSRTACSQAEINRIKDYYQSEGYELITVGGKATDQLLTGKTENLQNIAYYMSKADLHIGIDSGMMNLAKLVMPCEKMHIYTSDTDDFKSSLLKRCEEKGTKVNYSR
jgi:hypothetical protein